MFPVNWPTISRVKDIVENKETPYNKNHNYDWLKNWSNTYRLKAIIRYLETAHNLIDSRGMMTHEENNFDWMQGKCLNEVLDCQMKLSQDKPTSNVIQLKLINVNKGWDYKITFLNGEIRSFINTGDYIS